VRKIKIVNAKYRIKNNITELVSRFLRNTKNSRASNNESRNLTDSAISVINTLFSATERVPLKKNKSEISAATVKPAVRINASVQTNMEGRILFSPSKTSVTSSEQIKRDK
jgi:hypothetical protein